MNTHIANLTNAAVMIVMGSWAYLSSANPSPTSLIPVFLGVILVVMSQGVKHEQKAQAHVAVVVTLLAFISLAENHCLLPYPKEKAFLCFVWP